MATINQKTFEELLPVAYQWAKEQEQFVLARGVPLPARYIEDACRVGVKDYARVRMLVVDRISLPAHAGLADAARRTGIVTEDTRCIGFGHALIVRVDAWGDRELILHNLVHIAQCERSGGLEQWVSQYLCNRTSCPDFTVGSLEEEARRIAHEICSQNQEAA